MFNIGSALLNLLKIALKFLLKEVTLKSLLIVQIKCEELSNIDDNFAAWLIDSSCKNLNSVTSFEVQDIS